MGARTRKRKRPRPDLDHARSLERSRRSGRRFLSDRPEQCQDIRAKGFTCDKAQGVHYGMGQKEIEGADKEEAGKEDMLSTDDLRPLIGVSGTRSGNRRRMLATVETTDCLLASRHAVDSQPPGRLR